jgi:phospholipid/cholesterol/gamma-HCH transport system substrate-binding protein
VVKEAKVGIAVTIGLAMLMLLIFMIGGLHILERGYNIYVFFNNLGDLKLRAPVKMSGVEIGMVKSIDLVEGMARVRLWIKDGIRIPSRSKVTISTIGIVGETYVDVSPEGKGGPYLKEGDRIRGIDPVGIGAIMMKGEELSREAMEAMSSLNILLSAQETRKALYGILKNTENITGRIDLLVRSNISDISATIKGIRASVEGLERSLELFSSDLERMREAIAKNTEDVRKGISEARGSIGEMGKRAARVMEGLEGVSREMELLTRGVRTRAESIGEDLEAASGSAKELMGRMDAMAEEMRKGLENVRASSENLLRLSRSLQDLAESQGGEVRSAISDLRRSSEILRSIAEKVESGEGLIGALIYDKELVDDLRTLLRDVKARPWRLLWRD